MTMAEDLGLGELLSLMRSLAREHKHKTQVIDVGTVLRVGDGVATISGLPQAMTDELVEFPNGVRGLILNLDHDWIDCILLGPDEGIQGGDLVVNTGRKVEVPVGESLLGRVIDPLGRPLDGKGPIKAEDFRFVEREAPSVVDRRPVNRPLQTGIKAIDSLIPIGRGQRELIIGDRQTGKTALAVDTIINQRESGVICVYVSIGQKKSSVMEVIKALEEHGALEHTIVVVADPDDPPALSYLAPYAGCTMAEEFAYRGQDALIVYDDLSKHADAYRELSLLLHRPPGREAYPGDIFYLHSRLMERAGQFSEELGGGSLTALAIGETKMGNIAAYIPTNLISMTDGQIYLDPDLFNRGFKPAIDVGLSVSRVGGQAQTQAMKKVSQTLRLELSQYHEVESFARFGVEVDEVTRKQIVRGERLREMLKQKQYNPMPLERQIAILYAASEGYLDDLPLERLADFEARFLDFLGEEFPSIYRRLKERWVLDEEIERDLREAIESFKRSFG